MLDTPPSDLAQAAPLPAPQAPEGADLMIRAKPHEEAFWDRHPDVERYRIEIRTGQPDLDAWSVLVWLKADAGAVTPVRQIENQVPTRPADATFVIHAAHDLDFFRRHPDVQAWRVALALNEDGPGAAHTVELWMKPGGA